MMALAEICVGESPAANCEKLMLVEAQSCSKGYYVSPIVLKMELKGNRGSYFDHQSCSAAPRQSGHYTSSSGGGRHR